MFGDLCFVVIISDMKTFSFFTKNNEYEYNDLLGIAYLKQNKKRYKSVGSTQTIQQYLDRYSGIYFKNYHEEYGIRQLILHVTNHCNLRCRYCYFFSQTYDYAPDLKKINMQEKVAYKAIDIYLASLNKQLEKNPNEKGAITFYGGEPLLNFELIKKCVKYVKERQSNVSFHLTSNGTVINKEILDFLIDNNFYLSISLDGPKDMHDKNRVYSDGQGSYQTVYENLAFIKQYNLKYFMTNMQALAVFDWKTDLNKLRQFFCNGDTLRLMMINNVNPLDTSFYERFSKGDFITHQKHYDNLRNIYFENIKNKTTDKFLDRLFGISLDILLRHSNRFNDTFPFSVNCVPGSKIAVDVDGNFHLCEKCNYSFPIGDVDNGISYEKICNLFSEYINFVGKKCLECPISRICGFCFKDFMKDDGHMCIDNDLCQQMKAHRLETFSLLYSILESDNSLQSFILKSEKRFSL